MNRTMLQKGNVVQLNEHCKNPWFIGCFMTVTEPKSFGAQGFVQMPGIPKEGAACVIKDGRARAFYRAAWEEMDYIGHTNLLPADQAEEQCNF